MEDPRGDEGALTPEEMSVLQEMGMAVGGFVQQPTQSNDPYMQQQQMYQQPSPVAVGNTGYAEGGLEDGTAPAFDPEMYGAGFSFLSPSTPQEPTATTVMLYSPDGLTTQSFSLPAQQTEYDAKLAAGWSTTQVQTPQVTTQAGVDKDEDYGGPVKPTTGKDNKPFSEMTPDELKEAYNSNLKARTLMEGMALINPLLGLAGMGATKFAESQIIQNMKDKGVAIPDPEENKGIIAGITNWFSETFGTKKDKEPVVTPKGTSAVTPTFTKADSSKATPTKASNVLGTSEDSSTTDSLANTVAAANVAAKQAGSTNVKSVISKAGTADQKVFGGTQAEQDYVTSAAAGAEGGLMSKAALNKKAKKKK